MKFINFRLKALVFLLFSLLINPGWLLSQSRKEIKKYSLKSTTITVVDYAGSKETSQIESVEKYDKDGNVIESTQYNKDGSFRKKEIRSYNKAGKIIQQSRYDENGGLVNKTVFTYNDNNDKLSEQKSDGSGKVLEWIKYGYNSMGEKIFETELDEKGKTIRKSIYTYDKNGLKKEKKIYNSQEVLISIKRYSYKTTGD